MPDCFNLSHAICVPYYEAEDPGAWQCDECRAIALAQSLEDYSEGAISISSDDEDQPRSARNVGGRPSLLAPAVGR